MNKKHLIIILEIVGIILFGTSIILYSLPFISCVLDSGNVNGFELLKSDIYFKTVAGYICVFGCFLMIVGFFIILIIAFIMDCLNININQESNDKHRVFLITIGSISVFLSVGFVCIINFNVLKLCRYTETGLVYLGSGAISTSILFSIGMIIIEIIAILKQLKTNDSKSNGSSRRNDNINYMTIEEELTKLKSLKDKGLISDEDYMKKKNQILGL